MDRSSVGAPVLSADGVPYSCRSSSAASGRHRPIAILHDAWNEGPVVNCMALPALSAGAIEQRCASFARAPSTAICGLIACRRPMYRRTSYRQGACPCC